MYLPLSPVNCSLMEFGSHGVTFSVQNSRHTLSKSTCDDVVEVANKNQKLPLMSHTPLVESLTAAIKYFNGKVRQFRQVFTLLFPSTKNTGGGDVVTNMILKGRATSCTFDMVNHSRSKLME